MATTPRSKDLIAEARELYRGYEVADDLAWPVTATAQAKLADMTRRLADALEAAEKRATEAEAERDGIAKDRADQVRRKRETARHLKAAREDLAAALAVIEKARRDVILHDVRKAVGMALAFVPWPRVGEEYDATPMVDALTKELFEGQRLREQATNQQNGGQ